MTKDELAKAKGPILTFPDTLGAVVLAYNLPDLKGRLNLTADDHQPASSSATSRSGTTRRSPTPTRA